MRTILSQASTSTRSEGEGSKRKNGSGDDEPQKRQCTPSIEFTSGETESPKEDNIDLSEDLVVNN